MAYPADDLHVHDQAECDSLRSVLLTQLFGGTLPTTIPTATTVASPVAGMPATCQKLSLGGGVPDAYYWPGDSRLAVVHQGHSTTFDQLGVGELIRDLKRLGLSVVACSMPGGGSVAAHNTGTIPLRSFVDAVIGAINYGVSQGATDVFMTGLSGGGWTTTLAAAIDSRISRSVAIAGSLPLYMPITGTRDWEQFLPGLSAGYLDLYVLAADQGREHRQILLYSDGCFTWANFVAKPDYRSLVRDTAAAMGGTYSLTWLSESIHQVSPAARFLTVEALTGEYSPQPVYVDSHDTSVVRVGTWTSWNPTANPGCFGSNEYTHPAATAAQYLEWPLPIAPGTYEIAARWSTNVNRATNAPYRIYDGGTQIAEIRVNQESAPNDISDGWTWERLGTWTFSGAVSVRLCADANEYVDADAVRAVKIA